MIVAAISLLFSGRVKLKIKIYKWGRGLINDCGLVIFEIEVDEHYCRATFLVDH